MAAPLVIMVPAIAEGDTSHLQQLLGGIIYDALQLVETINNYIQPRIPLDHLKSMKSLTVGTIDHIFGQKIG